jgi:hypothetical protein
VTPKVLKQMKDVVKLTVSQYRLSLRCSRNVSVRSVNGNLVHPKQNLKPEI